MTGELFTVKVENTTDNKIGRGGKIFLPKSTRTASVSAYGLAEIRACRGLVIHTTAPGDGDGEDVAEVNAADAVEVTTADATEVTTDDVAENKTTPKPKKGNKE
jgi:hypothetical protein